MLTRDEALSLVRRYKEVISARFDCEPRVYLFGSYSKGSANPWSDIDVAVILPSLKDVIGWNCRLTFGTTLTR